MAPGLWCDAHRNMWMSDGRQCRRLNRSDRPFSVDSPLLADYQPFQPVQVGEPLSDTVLKPSTALLHVDRIGRVWARDRYPLIRLIRDQYHTWLVNGMLDMITDCSGNAPYRILPILSNGQEQQ